MSEYWSTKTVFAGFATKTDFNSIIDATVKVEKYRYNQLSKEEAALNFKKEQITGLNNTMVAYKKQIESMDTIEEFLVRSTTSSDTSILSATAKAGAAEGSHVVEVQSLATTSSVVSGQRYTDVTQTLDAAGQTAFSFTYGVDDSGNPVSYSVNLTAGMTVGQLIGEIENETGGKVKAKLINTGEGSRIQLRGMGLGAENSITLGADAQAVFTRDPAATDPPYDAALDTTKVTAATDAKLVVDGVAFTRKTNSISDIIDGVTLSLNDSEVGKEVTLKVATDYDAITKNVENFVKLTNELRDGFKLVKDYKNAELDKKGVNYSLKTNPQIARVESQLKNLLATGANGFLAGTGANTDPFTSLSMVGIKTIAKTNDKNLGKLEFDKNAELREAGGKTFTELLKSDPESVAMLFAASGQGSSDNSAVLEFDSSLYSMGVTKAGRYEVEYTGGISFPTNPSDPGYAATQDITVNINGTATVAKYDVATNVATVGSGNAKGLAFKIVDNTAGSHTATLSIKEGKIKETVDTLNVLTDSESGILNIMVTNYTDQIENPITGLKKQMEEELARVSNLEKRLIQKYAIAEKTLANYQNIQSMLEFQLKSQLAQD